MEELVKQRAVLTISHSRLAETSTILAPCHQVFQRQAREEFNKLLQSSGEGGGGGIYDTRHSRANSTSVERKSYCTTTGHSTTATYMIPMSRLRYDVNKYIQQSGHTASMLEEPQLSNAFLSHITNALGQRLM